MMKIKVGCSIQNQPSRGVFLKRCSKNMQQTYGRTPMPKCDFNKVVFLYILEHLFLGTLLDGCSEHLTLTEN